MTQLLDIVVPLVPVSPLVAAPVVVLPAPVHAELMSANVVEESLDLAAALALSLLPLDAPPILPEVPPVAVLVPVLSLLPSLPDVDLDSEESVIGNPYFRIGTAFRLLFLKINPFYN